MTNPVVPAALALSPVREPQVDRWSEYSWLICNVNVDIPVAGFTVRQLLQLQPGTLVESSWEQAKELPLCVNGEQIGVAQFDPVGDCLAVRISELL